MNSYLLSSWRNDSISEITIKNIFLFWISVQLGSKSITVRGSERPAAHTQQKFTQVPPPGRSHEQRVAWASVQASLMLVASPLVYSHIKLAHGFSSKWKSARGLQ